MTGPNRSISSSVTSTGLVLCLNMDSQREIVIENWMRHFLNHRETYSIDFIPIILEYCIDDLMNLSSNPKWIEVLTKIGDNSPKMEKVIFSMQLTRINKRGKEQDRIIAITDKAMYNIKPKQIHKCPRRIDLDSIVSVTMATKPDSSLNYEMVIHSPEQ